MTGRHKGIIANDLVFHRERRWLGIVLRVESNGIYHVHWLTGEHGQGLDRFMQHRLADLERCEGMNENN